ncbi:MAG TPA: acyl-CoA dehydrogenase family protein [Pirellulales bacterium]|jgi:alkylation response protein AidB-like acyl-CoA dehydrogenase|nr:acyl-CoA dehydrogenase family protein [Pirellulales bacterium]
MPDLIESPFAPGLDELCAKLRGAADQLTSSAIWPVDQLRWCGEYGVHRWFVSRSAGGFGWSDADQIRGYLRLSAACLTTTFILTQRNGAVRRIAEGDLAELKPRLLPDLLSGQTFATVAISHLTTSRRHLAQPAMRATESGDDFVLDGYSAWVTGGAQADTIVTGASLADGRQLLLALPTDLPGVRTPPPEALLALSSSQTGRLECAGVRVARKYLLAGPLENVMATAVGAKAGGLQTSTLAAGLSQAAIEYLVQEGVQRAELQSPAAELQAECAGLQTDLLAAAAGTPVCSNDELRRRANSLALRSTQAALTAAKGAGYVIGHPAGRWAAEALFFLVWSCPAPVANAVLCELAGLDA